MRTALDPPDDSAYDERCDDCAHDIDHCICDPDRCPMCPEESSPLDAPYCSSWCALEAEHENDLDGLREPPEDDDAWSGGFAPNH